jgi:GNAT superfamily N-acetyltransferase
MTLGQSVDGVAIRRARPGDAAPVRALVKQLGYSPDDRSYDETFAQVARHPEAAVFIAQIGTRVVGYLAMSHRPQVRLGARVAFVDELAVADAERGRGIGGALLNTAIAHARSLSCSRLEINSSRVRESYLRHFYAERGLDEVDTAVFRVNLVNEAPGRSK